MPNIMLTYRCNLKCSYCFANEFVNKDRSDISEDNFDKAIEFLTASGPVSIGLIGGEPTIHSQFKTILEKIIANPLIREAVIYTNGIRVDEYINQIVHPKFRLLINCNSPQDIGEIAYTKLRENLNLLFHQYYMKDRINLGINLYSDDMDYSYIIDLLKRCGLHRVRISVTVPDFSACDDIDALEIFRSRKDFLLKFFKDMEKNDILPYYDCNKPPYCVWNDEEKAWLESYVGKYKVESNLIGNHSQCFPVIDILPDLRAVRCFGMSDFTKVNILDFRNITDLASFFLNHIDASVYKMASCEDCKNCYERKIRQCTAGCIGFQSSKIKKANEFFVSL